MLKSKETTGFTRFSVLAAWSRKDIAEPSKSECFFIEVLDDFHGSPKPIQISMFKLMDLKVFLVACSEVWKGMKCNPSNAFQCFQWIACTGTAFMMEINKSIVFSKVLLLFATLVPQPRQPLEILAVYHTFPTGAGVHPPSNSKETTRISTVWQRLATLRNHWITVVFQ